MHWNNGESLPPCPPCGPRRRQGWGQSSARPLALSGRRCTGERPERLFERQLRWPELPRPARSKALMSTSSMERSCGNHCRPSAEVGFALLRPVTGEASRQLFMMPWTQDAIRHRRSAILSLTRETAIPRATDPLSGLATYYRLATPPPLPRKLQYCRRYRFLSTPIPISYSRRLGGASTKAPSRRNSLPGQECSLLPSSQIAESCRKTRDTRPAIKRKGQRRILAPL